MGEGKGERGREREGGGGGGGERERERERDDIHSHVIHNNKLTGILTSCCTSSTLVRQSRTFCLEGRSPSSYSAAKSANLITNYIINNSTKISILKYSSLITMPSPSHLYKNSSFLLIYFNKMFRDNTNNNTLNGVPVAIHYSHWYGVVAT